MAAALRRSLTGPSPDPPHTLHGTSSPPHPTTISKARSEVKRFIERFGHQPIDSIRAVEVEQYKRSRLLDYKAAKETVGKEIRRLKAAFNRGVEWKELDVNPLSSVKALAACGRQVL
ncbi:hypothetical protein [Stenotrophomonas indicatrix]